MYYFTEDQRKARDEYMAHQRRVDIFQKIIVAFFSIIAMVCFALVFFSTGNWGAIAIIVAILWFDIEFLSMP